MDKRSLFFIVAIIVSAVGLQTGSAWADAALERTIGPGVVFIKGAERSGSGVVVREEGVILTNSNIVENSGEVTIHATLTKNGRTTYKRFSATVTGRHPEYPLALLQADVPEGYQMVRLKSAADLPSEGAACYAVGCAEDNRSTTKRDITEGEVKGTEKSLKGKTYMEVSTTVNPVNNGGAVADKNGQLIGVLINQYRGSGYSGIAVNIRSIRPSEFISANAATPEPAGADNAEPEPVAEDDTAEPEDTVSVEPGPAPVAEEYDEDNVDDEDVQAMMADFEEEEDEDVSIIGLILVLFGFIAIMVGRIWLLMVAYREGCLWALGVFMIDIVALIFVIQHWDESKKPFLISVAGFILIIVGVIAG